MRKVIGYKMTNDSGFAPNPFYGYLTLATCKPSLRRSLQRGDWVAGFASKTLVASARRSGLDIPYMGLVYLMQVTENPMPLADYFEDRRFARKKPEVPPRSLERSRGDNIYFDDGKGGFGQLENSSHGLEAKARDTGGRNALISTRFWYFGRSAYMPEGSWQKSLGLTISEARTFRCPSEFLPCLERHLQAVDVRPGVIAKPCIWSERSSKKCDAGGR